MTAATRAARRATRRSLVTRADAVAAAALFVHLSAADAARHGFIDEGRPHARAAARACCRSPARSAPSSTRCCSARWSACSAPRSASCSPSPRCAPNLPRGWVRAARRGDLAAADLAAVHHLDRVHLLVRAARAHHLRAARHARTSTSTACPARCSAEMLTYFPIAYLTLRPVLAAIGGNLEEMAFSLGSLALARLPHRDAAAGAAGPRQRVPAAVRGLAGRFRDAADPRRQQSSRCCRPRPICRSPACSTSRAAPCCRCCCSCRPRWSICCSATGSSAAHYVTISGKAGRAVRASAA